MSYTNFSKALEILKGFDDYDSGSGVSAQCISNAEKKLGINFSQQISHYLTNYGYIEFFGVELYGIIDEEISYDSVEGCMVEWSVVQREKYGLNHLWLPIKFDDDGCMAFFDFSDLNKENEPSIISAVLTNNGWVLNEKLADDFGDYLLCLIDEYENE